MVENRNRAVIFVGVILTLVLALTANVLLAQDFDLGLEDALISGDVNDPSWATVQNFFVTRDYTMLGDDFVWEGPFTGGAIADDDLGTVNTIFDRNAFAEADYDINTVIVGETATAVEFTFNGTWTGPFMGFEPNNAIVDIPAVAIFNFDEAGLVSRVRVYYDSTAFQQQLGIMSDAGLGVETGVIGDEDALEDEEIDESEEFGDEVLVEDDEGILGEDGGIAEEDALGEEDDALEDEEAFEIADATLDEITDDPAAYMGMYVSVVGTLEEFVGGVFTNGLIIVEEDLIGDDPALVIGETPEVLALYDWELDTEVAVTGWVRGLNITELEAEFGYDLDDDLYVDYEGYPVIVAREVAPVLDE